MPEKTTEKAKVYFASARVLKWTHEESLPGKLEGLLEKAGLEGRFKKDDAVAVKTHFGSHGAHRVVRPIFLRKVTEAVGRTGAAPFVTDTVRIKGLQYLEVANSNGINHLSVGAPVVLADGLFGNDNILLDAGDTLGQVAVASAIHDAQGMVVVSHVKGHINAGYAGAIKNLAMGGVSGSHRTCGWKCGRGSMHMIGMGQFNWDEEKCELCYQCQEVCPLDCISFPDEKFSLDSEKCWRCGRCVRVCPVDAIEQEGADDETFMRGLAAAAKTVLGTFEPGKVLYINFLLEIQPECDCMPGSDVPVVQDLGIMLSDDLAAIEQASMDMISRAAPLAGSAAEGLQTAPGADVFKQLHNRPWEIQMQECEKLGLGTRKYQLMGLSD